MTNSRKHMFVVLTRDQWRELRVTEHKTFVRAAFYLGLPYTYIQTRVSAGSYFEDRANAIESALELGMNDDDKVVIMVPK